MNFVSIGKDLEINFDCFLYIAVYDDGLIVAQPGKYHFSDKDFQCLYKNLHHKIVKFSVINDQRYDFHFNLFCEYPTIYANIDKITSFSKADFYNQDVRMHGKKPIKSTRITIGDECFYTIPEIFDEIKSKIGK